MTDYEQIFHDAAEVNISLSAGIAAVVSAAKRDALEDAAQAIELHRSVFLTRSEGSQIIRALAAVHPEAER